MLMTEGTPITVYALRQKTGRYRNNDTDPFVFIGFTARKTREEYLRYFKRRVTGSDSLNHNAVHEFVQRVGLSRMYVRLIDRTEYDIDTRDYIVGLQNRYDCIIKYP